MQEIDTLRQEELDLERKLVDVRTRISRTSKEGGGAHAAERRPLRELVLDALNDARAPLNSLLIASVFRPLYKRELPATRFGTLSADEQGSFDSNRPRPVYLCHGLTHDRGQAMKRFWARSDWPLEDRIIGPMSGRLLFLKGALWVIHLAEAAGEGSDADRLRFVAADQARDAGYAVRRNEFPYRDWVTHIESQIARYSEEDRLVRVQASTELAARLSARALLFGATGELVSIPGTSMRWNSKSS